MRSAIWVCLGLLACSDDGDTGEASREDASVRDAAVMDARVPIADARVAQDASPDARPDASPSVPTDASVSQALSLSLFNVVRAEPLAKPLTDKVERVELPPRVTVSASSTLSVAAVRFLVDGKEQRLDTEAPFLLDEKDGKPSAWTLSPGEHSIEARAYAETAAEGTPLATATWSFRYARTGLAASFTALSSSANQAWTDSNLDGVMKARSFQGSMGTLPYRIFVPDSYDAKVHYPLLVYLHGRGERGTDNRQAVYRNSRLFTGPRSIVSPNFQNDYPAIVIAPQCGDSPSNQEWARWIGNSEAEPFAGIGSDGSYKQAPMPWPSELHVRELVEALQKEFSIDADRVYLTGESMGGFGTWDITTRWPELWAAGIPMAGYSDRTLVSRILKIPYWVFHGSEDEYNTVAGSRAMVKAIMAAGGEAKLTEYAGLKHIPTFQRAWTEEPELLPWIFAQLRKP